MRWGLSTVQPWAQTACAWCKRFQWQDGTWRTTEEFSELPISHGICPECKAEMSAALKAITDSEDS